MGGHQRPAPRLRPAGECDRRRRKWRVALREPLRVHSRRGAVSPVAENAEAAHLRDADRRGGRTAGTADLLGPAPARSCALPLGSLPAQRHLRDPGPRPPHVLGPRLSVVGRVRLRHAVRAAGRNGGRGQLPRRRSGSSHRRGLRLQRREPASVPG